MSDNNCILFETEGIAKSDRVLYTPGEFAKQNLLFVQEAGTLTSLSAHKSAHKRLNSYLLLEVITGSGIVAIGNKEYRLRAGNAILIDCNQYYWHISDVDNPWTIAWIHFDGYAARGYYGMITKYLGENRLLSNILLKQSVDSLMPLLRENRLSNELHVAEKLQHILDDILNCAVEGRKTQDKVNWNAIREYVNEKCMTDDFVIENYLSEIERVFGIEQDRISFEFSSHFGIDLDSYIAYRKLSVAKEKLRFTTKTIDEIMSDTGIKDNKAFEELFKKHEHVTPSEYRRSWAQWIRG